MRECEEETGLHALVLGDKLAETYHIYREKNNARALKKQMVYFTFFEMIFPSSNIRRHRTNRMAFSRRGFA